MCPDIIRPRSYQGLTTQSLARLLFKAELGEAEVRAIPAQSLYMAIRHIGIPTAAEIIESASVEQCRVMLDLDLWSHDRFTEDRVWDWLSLSEASSDLAQLQKFIKFVDLKIVALLVQRHVEVQTFSEPTEKPPAPHFHTPDKGYTWLNVKCEEQQQNFLLNRLLAMIFETDADLFYQLLNISVAQTDSMLEEESYIDRNRRLSSDGVPDHEAAARICMPLSEAEGLKLLRSGASHAAVSEIVAVEPLIYTADNLQPLDTFVQEVGRRDQVEAELTLLMNACIVRYGADYTAQEEVLDLTRKVRGAINIGLEIMLHSEKIGGGTGFQQIFEALGLRGLFGLGIYRLNQLRKEAAAAVKRLPDLALSDQIALLILEAAAQPIPKTSSMVGECGKLQDSGKSQVSPELVALEKLAQIDNLHAYIRSFPV